MDATARPHEAVSPCCSIPFLDSPGRVALRHNGEVGPRAERVVVDDLEVDDSSILVVKGPDPDT